MCRLKNYRNLHIEFNPYVHCFRTRVWDILFLDFTSILDVKLQEKGMSLWFVM